MIIDEEVVTVEIFDYTVLREARNRSRHAGMPNKASRSIICHG